VDWFRVAPERYSHLVLACGPVGPDLAVARIVERFAGCRRVAVNVSMVGDPSWQPFDHVLARDGSGDARPDLSLAAPAASVPVVARVEVHAQGEYADARPDVAHAAFDRLLASRPAAAFAVDTRLDPEVPGRRAPAETEALIGRADVVLTTRLHGLVLALRQGVPVVAVDPIVGGAKVLPQAQALGWPAALGVEALDDGELARHFEWCLSPEGRAAAVAAGRAHAGALAGTRDELLAALGVGARA
jgi:hypothetical protein